LQKTKTKTKQTNKNKTKAKTTIITKNQDVTTYETKLPTEKNHYAKAMNYCHQAK